SLELWMSLVSPVGQCDNGYACVYQNNLSWSSPTTPLPAEAHPRLVFETLFGEGGSPVDRRGGAAGGGDARGGGGPPGGRAGGPAPPGQPARLRQGRPRPARAGAGAGGPRQGRPVSRI